MILIMVSQPRCQMPQHSQKGPSQNSNPQLECQTDYLHEEKVHQSSKIKSLRMMSTQAPGQFDVV